MNPLNDLGLLKMDFRLKTLTVIEDTIALIRNATGISLKYPSDNPAVCALQPRRNDRPFPNGIGGMTSVSKQMDAKLDDIMALIALYRPGPMDLIGDYIKRKKGLTKIKYEHPLLEEICSDTYGVMIYQEQVMAAANRLAGYSLGQSDLLRRAMGKKDKAKMAKERANFIAGCAKTNRIPEKKANAIFDLLEKFAGYGFNKSHSAAYGLISYQTAYLKANYPVEFMAGLLSNEINNTDKISIFVGECKRMGIPILPPDMNRSSLKFTPEISETWEGPVRSDGMAEGRGAKAASTLKDRAPGLNGSRYGRAAIKNVGEGARGSAIAERERRGDFTSLEDFCSRLDSRIANRKIIESLVKAGPLTSSNAGAPELFACIEGDTGGLAASHRDRAAGQVSLAICRRRRLHARRTLTRRGPIARRYRSRKRVARLVTGHPLDALRVASGERKASGHRVVRRVVRSRHLHDRGRDFASGPQVYQERGQTVRGCLSRRPDRNARGCAGTRPTSLSRTLSNPAASSQSGARSTSATTPSARPRRR